MEKPPKIQLAHVPTPIEPLPRLSERWGADIRVKRDDLTGIEMSGNKVRKLEYLLAKALGRGCDSVITRGASGSNHARATAFAARKTGLECHLVLAVDDPVPDVPSGNLFLDYIAGAHVHFIPTRESKNRPDTALDELADALRRENKNPYVIPTGGSNATGIWGYADVVEEIRGQCGAADWRPDWIVCAVGSGGTYAGLLLGLALTEDFAPRAAGVMVCGGENTFARKIEDDIREAIGRSGLPPVWNPDAMRLVSGYQGGGYAKTDPGQLAFLLGVAREEGLLLDPVYTNKAFRGLRGELRSGAIPQGSRVLFIHTGGAFGMEPFSEPMADIWRSKRHWPVEPPN